MGHHLILGETLDFLTGESIPDTLDERYRQGLARRLVEKCGFARAEIEPRRQVTVTAGDKKAAVSVDLAVRLDGRICMILRFAPGSLVTRHRPALAASRLLAGCRVPRVVVTNGEDADILDGGSGEITARGLDALPTRDELLISAQAARFEPLSDKQREAESRLLYAYEVDDACPCDDTVCRLS